MPASELKVTLTGNGVTVVFNDYATDEPTWILRNTGRFLSKLGTRQSVTPKQSAHGVDDGLSQDDGRTLFFEGELHATSQDDRKTKERLLRQCVALPANQSYADDDGYILVELEDEDELELQCYAKIVNYPEFDIIDNTDPEMRTVEFVMFAKDPTLYASDLTTETGPEAVESTTFTIQDGDLPSFEDGDLPIIQDSVTPLLTVTNGGTTGAAPVITVFGPSENPVVRNLTTGKTMELTNGGGLTLLVDERVEIDVATETITKFDDSEVESDASANLSLDSEWIYVEPGANIFTVMDDSPGEIEAELEVSFREAYK